MVKLMFCLGLWMTMALFVVLGYALGTDLQRRPTLSTDQRRGQSRSVVPVRADCFFGDRVGVE